jgi:uroporphyrinogen-III synthase
LVVYSNNPEYIPALEGTYDAVLFYSPSGIDGFKQNNPLNNQTVYCCIGSTTANYLNGLQTGLNYLISKGNSTREMINELYNYFNNKTIQ